MIDGLVTSLGHLSINSPVKPSVNLPGHEESIDSMMVPYQEAASHSRRSGTPELWPWQGPLLAPRSSPRMTIGDAIAKAKLLDSSPRSSSTVE
jgi:hypothetical protein